MGATQHLLVVTCASVHFSKNLLDRVGAPAPAMWHLTRVLLGLFVFAPLCLVLLALGAVAGASIAARAADRRARAKWRTAAVQRLTDASASDVRRILGELPPWVADSAFQRVRYPSAMQVSQRCSHSLRRSAGSTTVSASCGRTLTRLWRTLCTPR